MLGNMEANKEGKQSKTENKQGRENTWMCDWCWFHNNLHSPACTHLVLVTSRCQGVGGKYENVNLDRRPRTPKELLGKSKVGLCVFSSRQKVYRNTLVVVEGTDCIAAMYRGREAAAGALILCVVVEMHRGVRRQERAGKSGRHAARQTWTWQSKSSKEVGNLQRRDEGDNRK